MQKLHPRFRCFSWLLTLPLLLSLQGCGLLSLKDKLLDMLVDKIPIELETAIGERILPTVLPKEAIHNDPEALKLLSNLLEPLFKANKINSPPFRLLISKDPQLNAFALPGGILVFNSGMLRAAATPEEVLGVAAHEIAHATERHVLKSMIQTLSLTAMLTFFLGDLSGLSAFLIQQGQILLQNGFSRVQEAEADRVGFDYLVAARIDPNGMTQFFKRIESQADRGGQQDGGSMAKVESFFSTHPLTAERIKNVEGWIQELPETTRARFRASPFPLETLKARLPGPS